MSILSPGTSSSGDPHGVQLVRIPGRGTRIVDQSAYANEIPPTEAAPVPELATTAPTGPTMASRAYNGLSSAGGVARDIITHPATRYGAGAVATLGVLGIGGLELYRAGAAQGAHQALHSFNDLSQARIGDMLHGAPAAAPAVPANPKSPLDGIFGINNAPAPQYVDNGVMHIEKSINPDFQAARYYLQRSPQFAAFMNELERTHPITVQPLQQEDFTNPPAFKELLGGSNVTWESTLGRRAEQPRDEEHLAVCGTQSPAVELVRSLYERFGVRQYPTYAKMLKCIGDLFHGNQDNYRINAKVNEGLASLGEQPASISGALIPAKNVTDHETCAPNGATLTDRVRQRNPVLRDENFVSCISLSTDALGRSGFNLGNIRDNRVDLTDHEIAKLSRIKQHADDLGFRASEAARENGTSPVAFTDENNHVRHSVALLLDGVQTRVGENPDPFFDQGVIAKTATSDSRDFAPALGPKADARKIGGVGHADVTTVPERLPKPAPAPEATIHVPAPVRR